MELNKFKIEKKRVLQIILFLAGASIIFFTYFSNLEKEDSTFVSEKIETIKPKDQYSDEKAQTNKFEDVEYKGIDTNGNRFVIGSQYANFEVEKPELITGVLYRSLGESLFKLSSIILRKEALFQMA